MNYGLYMSASAVSASMARQDVLSNNLANVSTIGFKPDVLELRTRDAASVEDRLPFLPSNKMLEKLGGGVFPMATRVNVEQGAMQSTSNALDLAIEGDGFFVARSPRAPASATLDESLRLSRDGRLTVGPGGTLVSAATGIPYLSEQNRPIQVNPASKASIQVDTDGTVRQGSAELGKLRIANVPDATRLIKDGDNLLKPPAGATLADATGMVKQGQVELSSVDAIKTMIGVTSASQSAQGGLSMIAMYSEMMSRAITSLGKVS